jgi:phage recombination protein Bet
MAAETALQRTEIDDGAEQPPVMLQRIQTAPPPVVFDAAQIETLKQTIAQPCNPQEFQLFVETCRRTGLDPFQRQIYAIVTSPDNPRFRKLVICVGIDGLRLIANRTGMADGISVEFCGKDGQFRQAWFEDTPPAAARCTVYRKDARRPFVAVVNFSEFAKRDQNGKLSGQWATMPSHMLSVRAQSQALRMAFPNDMANLQLAEEEEVTIEPAPRPQARVTEEAARRQALNQPAQAPAQTQQRQPRPAQVADPNAAPPAPAPRNGKCSICLAVSGHKPGCQNAPKETQGEELEMQPTPSGSPAKTEHDEARKRLFGAYKRAGGDDRDQAGMLRHCELVLAECLGETHRFTSRTQLSTDQMNICAEYFETRQSLPKEASGEAGGTLDYAGETGGADDPFQDE